MDNKEILSKILEDIPKSEQNKENRDYINAEDGTLEHKNFSMNYVKNFSKMESENIGLLLTGPVGTGKTYLATAIANALIEQGITVKMINLGVVLNDMTNPTTKR